MKKILFVLLTLFVFIGCKKEKKIERNLYKQGGEWNIATWEEKSVFDVHSENDYSNVTQNAGTMEFNEDGTGALFLNDGSDAYTGSFTYKNTASTLTIYDEDGEGKIFQLDWEKNEFTISSTDTDTYMVYDQSGNSTTEKETHTLRINCKKK